MKLIRNLVILLAAIGAVLVWMQWHRSADVSRVELSDAFVRDIRPMVQLCSVEIYEEVPVKATIGTRHMVARETLTGSVSFDLEKLESHMSGDTLVVTLPPEIVVVRESTAPDSYRVIDTWNDRLFSSGNFTTAEENAIKRRVEASAVRLVYSKGYVGRARREAVANLASMLASVTGSPVKVVDPRPSGYPSLNGL